jgi:anti-sigma B factor antagonist
MELVTKQFKHCDLIKVTGRIDSLTAPQLKAAIAAITDNGRFKIVLDMEDLEFMSSAGLWAIVSAQKNCRRYNRGAVVLANVPETIKSTLDLAGFIPFLKIYPDVTEAVGTF